MLFSCMPPDARIPGRFPGPPHERGRNFTIDIHCHVLTETAEAMFLSAGAVDRRPREVFASAHTREINRQQVERTRVQFHPPVTRYLVQQYGADHVLMGTDYPADMGEIDPIGFIEGAAGLSADERAMILGLNAARLLGITVPVQSDQAKPIASS